MSEQGQTVEALVDEKALASARKNAEAQYRDLGSEQIDYLRKRCKTDLFFLAKGPLEYTDLSPRFHGALTNWMHQTRDEQYRLILKPRGTYKSTITTISDCVQIALPNIADVQHHPHRLGPNATVLIAHEVRETAAQFLYEITAAFTQKPLMLALWPECIPDAKQMRVNKWQLDLPRERHPKAATFNTIGAGGAAQGGHYNWIKLDDIIGEKARDSDTVMNGTINWFDNILSLLEDISIDGWDMPGTRWSFGDVYSHAMKTYGINEEASFIKCMGKKEIEK